MTARIPALAFAFLIGAAQLVAPPAASAVEQRIIEYTENRVFRITALEPHTAQWVLAGEDTQAFIIHDGVLRFYDADRNTIAKPDYEHPEDADQDGIYRVTALSAEAAKIIDFDIHIVNRNEPGKVSLSTHSPAVGEVISASVMDPDGIRFDVHWQWQRRTDGGQWMDISEAVSQTYRPAAADAGRLLRVTALYQDGFGKNQSAAQHAPNPVIGPKLAFLSAAVQSNLQASLHPQFDPGILHYGIACEEEDVLTVSVSIPENTRLGINGIQPQPGPETAAAVAVNQSSDVRINLIDAAGAETAYAIHCAPEELAGLRTFTAAGSTPPKELFSVVASRRAFIFDANGVVRRHQGSRPAAGFFLRRFDSGHYAHALSDETHGFAWQVLDADFNPVAKVSTLPPLQSTGRHDFRIIDDGAFMLMAYERAVRDFSGFPHPHEGLEKRQAALTETPTRDSAIQIVEPTGEVRYAWNSWGRMPLEDCAQHRFPDDYAHINATQWTEDGILASFRGCSSVMMIDPARPDGDEIVWRIGETNLSDEQYRERKLGPPPMPVIGDPENTFCGQHAAQLVDDSRLLMFDNGVACTVSPETGEPLARRGGDYSRAVEYAIDYDAGEAVFLRAHSQGGEKTRLGRIGGHVEPMENGDWAISWGYSRNTDKNEHASAPPELRSAVTIVDPDTGEERFWVERMNTTGAFRALPLDPLVFIEPREPLHALWADPAPQSHQGPETPLNLVIAFSRPVAPFNISTPSIRVSGGALTAIAPEAAFGRSPYAWMLTVVPEQGQPAVIDMIPDIPCESGGICTADGTGLQHVPARITVTSQ